ncbi:hypothetical protein C8P63_108105 [Melghirimyces profundicolus]|uniref:Uncharacterized protein n=1 Tax=Melghirimyces profundicolus TaxID=1242148 RepID=A0A2T6BXK2_9BACL|nr:hypothetical protein [Melghirimyces profundicolus]PTX60795.1 hypothetical protein C8P63_108105 [Melghirimyces profundicolus]
MEKKSRTVTLDGERHVIGLDHRPDRGTVMLDGISIEKWERVDPGDRDHAFPLRGRRIGVHVRYDSTAGEPSPPLSESRSLPPNRPFFFQ